jgi:riboflavin kinase/FMN adenylyltransferase
MRSEPALLNQPAEAFLLSAVKACRPRAVVEGPDFNFGRGRQGSVQTLQQFAERLGFVVYVIETARCDELPGAPSVHSAAIRAALREGRVDLARAMLGRPHRVTGTVGEGAGRGAEFGFPTANLDDIPHLLPQQGVYAAVAQLEGGQLHLAAVNVGPQPTFGQGALRVEAHVLDWTAPLRGRTLGLHFIAWLRQQQRFAGVEELVDRIQGDVVATRRQGAALRELERRTPIPLPQ